MPAGFKGDVVWTLRYAGQTHAVPARSKSTCVPAQLAGGDGLDPAPPAFRSQAGPAGRGPTGIQAPPIQATVGTPLELKVWVTDDAVHDKEPIKFGRERPGMNVSWFKYAGPGPVGVRAAEDRVPGADRRLDHDQATFNEPGEYVVRVKADAFGYSDSSAGNQCCWTNGYQKVTVTR